MLPSCFPPVSTVSRWFYLWRGNGLWQTLNHSLLMVTRATQGREASPSAGFIVSRGVKSTESGGPSGCDAGKKIKGRKRHILTDTESNLVHAVIHTAVIQDRDGAPLLLVEIIHRFPWGRGTCSPMVAVLATNCAKPCAASADGPSRSSSDPMSPRALRSCPAVGSSDEHWHGSAATASQRTSNKPSSPLPHGSSSYPSSSVPAASQGTGHTQNNFESDFNALSKIRDHLNAPL